MGNRRQKTADGKLINWPVLHFRFFGFLFLIFFLFDSGSAGLGLFELGGLHVVTCGLYRAPRRHQP